MQLWLGQRCGVEIVAPHSGKGWFVKDGACAMVQCEGDHGDYMRDSSTMVLMEALLAVLLRPWSLSNYMDRFCAYAVRRREDTMSTMHCRRRSNHSVEPKRQWRDDAVGNSGGGLMEMACAVAVQWRSALAVDDGGDAIEIWVFMVMDDNRLERWCSGYGVVVFLAV
ncbi:hypothetical protein RJT34_06836 [Clitoria ternatea]|uniref:Uncharacterized protein n=1 Tax=Clitoria ternatea TaxID=43366 RepID=A0AAN9K600_CLITE